MARLYVAKLAQMQMGLYEFLAGAFVLIDGEHRPPNLVGFGAEKELLGETLLFSFERPVVALMNYSVQPWRMLVVRDQRAGCVLGRGSLVGNRILRDARTLLVQEGHPSVSWPLGRLVKPIQVLDLCYGDEVFVPIASGKPDGWFVEKTLLQRSLHRSRNLTGGGFTQ